MLILNKHELVSERELETCIDRILDLELDVPTPRVLSQKGRVDKDLVFGLDAKLASLHDDAEPAKTTHDHGHGLAHEHDDHQSEVEVLSVTLSAPEGRQSAGVDLEKLNELLREAPKDEVYRIKAILYASSPPVSSTGQKATAPEEDGVARYILNWAFGRWTFAAAPAINAKPAGGLPTPADSGAATPVAEPVVRMTIMAARGESAKWKWAIERDGLVTVAGGKDESTLSIERVG